MPRKKNSRAAQGAGNIRKKTVLRNGKEYTFWEARVTVGRDPGTGKQMRRSFSGKTQKEVREKMQAAAVAVNDGDYFEPSKMSVGQWLDTWAEEYLNSVKPRTVESYKANIKQHIKPAIGKYRRAALSSEPLQKLIHAKFNQGYSHNTLAVLKGILTGSLSYAVQPLKYIPFSPAEYIDIPSTRATPKVKTRSAPHVYLSAEQMGKLFQRFPEGSSSYLPLLIGYKCGLRIAEAFALEWKDIDLTAKS